MGIFAMRPFSFLAIVFRVLWDGVPALVWLGFTFAAFLLVGRYLGTPTELTAPFAFLALVAVLQILRPLRKGLNLYSYYRMVRSSFRPLVELGIWKLLLVHDHYWRREEPLYEGTQLFIRAYHEHGPDWQQKINQILWRVEATAKAHLAKPARAFLREVDAPLHEELQ
jgi:hypothetical protein